MVKNILLTIIFRYIIKEIIMNEFIITFRECLEASLIIGIIYTVLHKNDLVAEKRVLWYGVIASLVASIIVGFLLTSINKSVGNTSYEKAFEAAYKDQEFDEEESKDYKRSMFGFLKNMIPDLSLNLGKFGNRVVRDLDDCDDPVLKLLRK